jgi:general secretion pathway protein G
MFHPQRKTGRRGGFTLVEILVVIAIIAVLVAMLLPAVMQVIKKGPQTVTASEIGQLDTSIQNFKATMGPSYFPSRIKLCEKVGDYGNTPLDLDSIAYLTALFPRILDPDPLTNKVIWATVGIDWNGDGVIGNNPANRTQILEGHQCLVFFLGGIPRNNPAGCFGWSTDPRDPAKLSQTTGRKGPFFEFSSDRLIDLTVAVAGAKMRGFYSYLDPHPDRPPLAQPQQPVYLYFSSYGSRNGYAKYLNVAGTLVLDNLSMGVQPYFEAAGRYHNPESYQIISAGHDHQFGPGGLWTRANAEAISDPGKDDQTNFNGGNLMVTGG